MHIHWDSIIWRNEVLLHRLGPLIGLHRDARAFRRNLHVVVGISAY